MEKNPASQACEDAEKFAKDGKFAEALARHIWFHDHALEFDESYYGVRLSFALGSWIELGRKYPPALTALLQIRDTKTERLLAGDASRALFHDVESINDRLHRPDATVELFKKISATRPEFAAAVYDLAEAALVTTGEFELAKKHLGDPMSRFLLIKRNFDEGMEFAESLRAGQASRRASKEIFTTDVIRLIKVLDHTGDRAAALAIQAQALLVLESPGIRDAISG